MTVNHRVAGSNPAWGAMLTVAQLVEHLIVIQKVASSILVCQPILKVRVLINSSSGLTYRRKR